MEKVLVTGGLGFIGSNIVRELIERKYEVKILDNISTGKLSNLNDIKNNFILIEGDLRDAKKVNEAVKGSDYIIHQAALPSVGRSIQEPLVSNDCNVIGSLNIMESARKHDVKKIIFASSSSVYGDTEVLPKKEDMALSPLSPYAVTKVSMEKYFSAYNNVYGLKSIGLRYFNIYGPYQNPESEYSAVIPRFIKSVLTNSDIFVYGDGRQTRDFTFVNDAVDANILAMESNIDHDIMNIGAGKPVSLLGLISLLSEILGAEINPLFKKPREGDVKESFADISKANELLGFSPKYDIKRGLNQTMEWIRKNHV